MEAAYAGLMRLVRAMSPLLAGGESKLARGIRGRRGAAGEMIRWAKGARDRSRPLAWFHAPSVGEGLQARAVMEAWRRIRPELQLVYTYFSPSAEGWAPRTPADFHGFLPWDVEAETGSVLDAVRPDVLVFTKTEVWPILSRGAVTRGIPTVLVAGTLPEGAGRLRRVARAALGPSFGRLALVAAISAEDGERFGRLGVPAGRVVVTGDPGIDSAAERAEGADPDAAYLRPFRDARRPTLVAGSTWGPDEDVILPALEEVKRSVPRLRAVVAPHEPTPRHVARLEDAGAEAGWTVQRLSALEEGGSADADLVVVDRVGVLAHLYTVGDLAFVGGGFHEEGLHSVLEPAAAGLPSTFGPENASSRAARDLLALGGAVEVRGVAELAATLAGWLRDPVGAGRVGEAASGYIRAHRGSAARTAALLEETITGL